MATRGAKRKPAKLYRVTWEIDLEARSPRAAAEEAMRIQRDTESIASIFDVLPLTGRITRSRRYDLGQG